jgi:hypothetical protein
MKPGKFTVTSLRFKPVDDKLIPTSPRQAQRMWKIKLKKTVGAPMNKHDTLHTARAMRHSVRCSAIDQLNSVGHNTRSGFISRFL